MHILVYIAVSICATYLCTCMHRSTHCVRPCKHVTRMCVCVGGGGRDVVCVCFLCVCVCVCVCLSGASIFPHSNSVWDNHSRLLQLCWYIHLFGFAGFVFRITFFSLILCWLLFSQLHASTSARARTHTPIHAQTHIHTNININMHRDKQVVAWLEDSLSLTAAATHTHFSSVSVE